MLCKKKFNKGIVNVHTWKNHPVGQIGHSGGWFWPVGPMFDTPF